MAGFAAVIDWARPVETAETIAMMDAVPHRCRGGITSGGSEHAAFSETRNNQDRVERSSIMELGHLSIVGDLRLWDRDSLRSRAGGLSATAGMDDRRLILNAYARSGTRFLEGLDGDYAFVIWDDRNAVAIAVRDRFGVKPLFFERTATGIRFASEVKQLAATSARPVVPDERSIVGHLLDRHDEPHATFFSGIERVRGATCLITTTASCRAFRYWDPSPEISTPPVPSDVPGEFRERLVESVHHRLSGTGTAVAQLTGGLDSSSVTASAHILDERRHLSTDLHTVSAVFPGHTIDETAWINEIAARQPFPHHDFTPSIPDIGAYDNDMWTIDGPGIVRIRDMWSKTCSVADGVDAGLLLTGHGGDDVLFEYQLLADYLRTGALRPWLSGIREFASRYDYPVSKTVLRSAASAAPEALKQPIRGIRGPGSPSSLIHRDLAHAHPAPTSEEIRGRTTYPSLTQNLVIAHASDPGIEHLNELQDALYASCGVEVSHPFLDRAVVEYLASIPVMDRPYDPRMKALVRRGFAGWLPDSVIERQDKTVADEYLDGLFSHHAPQYRERFSDITASAEHILDRRRYHRHLAYLDAGTATRTVTDELWGAWTLMAWL
ncbi:MAG: asparagine synthase-related protein, partial [Actinomycetia bacterium]|nr:asparagine synthase-related protein [Actinomycetes bacterium]